MTSRSLRSRWGGGTGCGNGARPASAGAEAGALDGASAGAALVGAEAGTLVAESAAAVSAALSDVTVESGTVIFRANRIPAAELLQQLTYESSKSRLSSSVAPGRNSKKASRL